MGQETRGDHQSQEKLVDVVVGKNQIGSAASDLLAGLVLGSSNHGVTDNGAETIDLGTKLDLDSLAILDLGTGLSLVGGERSVGSDVGRGGDSGGVGETFRWCQLCYAMRVSFVCDKPLLIFFPR